MRIDVKTPTGIKLMFILDKRDDLGPACDEIAKLVSKLESLSCSPVKTASENSPTGSLEKLKLVEGKVSSTSRLALPSA